MKTCPHTQQPCIGDLIAKGVCEHYGCRLGTLRLRARRGDDDDLDLDDIYLGPNSKVADRLDDERGIPQ